MSIRFGIKNTPPKADKEGDSIVRFTGTGEPFRRSSERLAQQRGVDSGGNKTFYFVTGLEEDRVNLYPWYNDEEKKQVKKQIKELRPLIAQQFGGEEAINPTNQYFWLRDRNVSRFSINDQTVDAFYDTKNPTHALLYLSVIAGAFIDTVAPTKEWADIHQIPHYLALESEDISEDDVEDITRSDAHAALSDLRKEESSEALFILAWCVLYDTTGYGAFLKSAPVKDLVSSHIKYIDGKLQLKKKRNTPKVFIEYVDKWKGQQTRPALFVEAYVKAGEYFNFIQQKQKKYETVDGTVLGNTIQEAVDNLLKPKFSQDFEKLRDQVEAKWKE